MADLNSSMQRRNHLTKEQRLPRCYKEVEKVIRSVKSCKKNYKTILANSRLRGSVHKKVYSLTVNILKHYNYIQKIIDKIQLLVKEKYLRREIASILIYEMIFGSGILPGQSKIVTTIQKYENDIRYAHEALQSTNEGCSETMGINIPRYVRVHTLVTTVPYVIKDLKSYGFTQLSYDEDLSEIEYLELVRHLEKGSFLIDFHFKDVLVFEHHENLLSLDLYKNGHVFLQDKSSYIPVHVLDPQPGCAVLDACAAPGMKTVHIASKMKNKGILIACERDKSRFESLRQMLDYGAVKICKTLCKDFKLLDPSDQAYSVVEYILLDPSCSGSGMVNRMDEVTDTEDSKNKERLMNLAGFQIILLKHALKFPSVKRVVYSTCSIHEEENEYVVHEALNAFNGTFKLAPVMPEWSHRGSEKFEFGKLCVRTVPEKHLSNGFFVAMFERVDYDEEKCAGKNEFSKKTKEYEMHTAKSEPFSVGENTSKRKKNKYLELEKESGKKAIKATNESFMYHDFPKFKDDTDMNLKYEYNNLQSTDYTPSKDSELYQKIDKTKKLIEEEENVINFNQSTIDAQMNYEPEKNKKLKKKKKKKSNELLCEPDELSLKTPEKFSRSPQNYLKLKENGDISCVKTEDESVISTRKNKTKRNKHQNSTNLTVNFETTEEFSSAPSLQKEKKHFGVVNVLSSETHMLQSESEYLNDSGELKNVSPKHKKKKKLKHREVEEKAPSFETQTLQPDSENMNELGELKQILPNVHLESPQNSSNLHEKAIYLPKIENPSTDIYIKKRKSKKDKHRNMDKIPESVNSTEIFEVSASLQKNKKKAEHWVTKNSHSPKIQMTDSERECLNKSNDQRQLSDTHSELQYKSSKSKKKYPSLSETIDKTVDVFTSKHSSKQNRHEIAENGASLCKKKKKYFKLDDINSLENQILDSPVFTLEKTSEQFSNSHSVICNDMQVENTFQNEKELSMEILSMKKKKHKHKKNKK